MISKIHCVAHVPPELRKAWLQHLRDFDIAHPGCHFEVSIWAPEDSVEEMIDTLSLDPDLPIKHVIPFKP